MPTDAAENLDMVEAVEENFSGNPDKFRELIEDAEKPLYTGCLNFTKLSAINQLLNLKSKYGETKMYSSTYEVKKAFKAMGSGYTKIHACVNNCILYRKEYIDLVACPTCGKSRWKVDEKINKIYNNIHAKCLWYFSITPRFKRLFQSKTTTKDLTWHAIERMVDVGVLIHLADSPAWAAIDDKYPDFDSEPRNLRLGISADRVDVNRGNRSHSVWPVLTVIYNLPPWLCMKRKFIMLSLLILGTPGNDIDVFLAPFIDDLQLLFDFGVETYDAYAHEHFKLRAVVLWTINDYPALGTLSGCPYSGFQGCVVCDKETHCIRLPESNNQSYAGHRRFLPYDHPFRRQKKAFNGQQEFSPSPEPMNGEEIYNRVKFIINKWGKVNNDKEAEIQQATSGRGGKMNKKKEKTTPTGQLRYWTDNLVPHCIDFMHVEKNVGESLTGTVLNVPGKTKDAYKARLDLVHYGLKPELHPQIEGNNTTLLAAGCTLTKEEKDKFCETLYNLRVPQGYCSNFSSLVSLKDRKLIGLKSHDYHMLIKEIIVDELDKLQEELCVTLCLLEKHFPPSFFDVMIHLIVHLTREVKLCGPIFFRWMYPFERMDTVGIPPDNHNNCGIHKGVDSSFITDGTPVSAAKSVEVSAELFSKAHFFVLQNTSEVLPYIE
ncbi:uncharacterized protein LOC111895950 [Lactuca sativa]|uniref:uncharacterized protein LOC111895950 n=1 Tax=Lactuca sativa TaxID=4236 RepID=UPI000CD938E7|nr:uncharacterized protein LOC111895950 [Lactuca sativa]